MPRHEGMGHFRPGKGLRGYENTLQLSDEVTEAVKDLAKITQWVMELDLWFFGTKL